MLYSQIISYELIQSWSKDDVANIYAEYGVPESTGDINYAVDGYKVLYFTPDFNDELVICSGAIFLPSEIGCPAPILSWQHGTESNDYGAPSNIGNTYNDLIGVISASNGYIVTMSDFIGLGEGEGIHNYMHAQTEATASIDLIIYGKELSADLLGVNPNEQLFIFGYSQGGHAAMAVVKEIEENYSNQLNVTASCPMAGPYDMSGSQRLMLETGLAYPNPGYLPFVLFSYDKIYNLYDDINTVLKPPYNNFLLSMYDGTSSMWTINSSLPNVPINIFLNDYYQSYLADDNHPFKVALSDNDVYQFSPQSPMRLLHCNGDDNVTYNNAEVAYNYFINQGLENIELIDGGNLNHDECASIAIIGAKLWIDTMADLCEPSTLSEQTKRQKVLIKNIDFIGRDLPINKLNKNRINIYNDGSFEKILIVK